jgi:peptide/nickel transport system substrate-binding protein
MGAIHAKRMARRALGAILVLLLATAVAGCAGSSSSVSTSSRLKRALDGSGQNLFNGARGGTLSVDDHEDFQSFDPGQGYFQLDYEVIYATQRPLFSYRPDQTQTVAPDLASAPASISSDGRTVTVHINHGIRFSPPVDREVTSADVAYAIERGANPNVANPYFHAYFDYIVGASRATGGPIPGISTPDKYTIVFHLTGPYANVLVGALSLPLSAPVPREFAGPLDAKSPTSYGSSYLVATGPYMVKADASGRILGVGYNPGRSTTLVRNPNWSASTDSRPAYLDRIDIKIGGDPVVIGRQVLTGSHLVQNDTPAGSIVKLAYQRYYKQLVAAPGAGDNYVALDNRSGPFSNVNVRKALWAALDRTAMLKVHGGEVVGQVGTHFIYPGSSGYQQAGGDAGPRVDYNSYPSGNPAVAKKYMKLAGFPGGKYTGSATITIVGSTGDPTDKDAALVNSAVQSLGFKTNFTLVDQSAMYERYCGVPARNISVCPNVGWLRDFADPQTILDPAFSGSNITATNNGNWGQVNDPEINAAIQAAARVVGQARRAEAWAGVDRMLVAQAVAIPWIFDKEASIESQDVRGISDLWSGGTWDYSYSSLK